MHKLQLTGHRLPAAQPTRQTAGPKDQTTRQTAGPKDQTNVKPDGLRLETPAPRMDEYHLENRLAQLMDGPIPLSARCPGEWRTRMMVDRTGRIHLWRGQVDHDTHAGIVGLINARFWVRENIQLIAMAHPECSFDLDAEPMLHVFTPEGAKGSVLDGMLGAYLKVHGVRGPIAAPVAEFGHQRRPA